MFGEKQNTVQYLSVKGHRCRKSWTINMLYILYERDEGKGCAENGLPLPSLYTHHVG